MARTVCIASDMLGYPTGAGLLWAYLNWALGFQALGCEVVWMEPYREPSGLSALGILAERLNSFGLRRICLFTEEGADPPGAPASVVPVEEAADADLLLDIAYGLPPQLLARFRRSVLLDIDPGQTQTWIAAGDIELAPYDIYLTIGEGIAAGTALVPDCGVRWVYAPPCVAVDTWSARPAPEGGAYTTVTHWWGEGSFVMPDGSVIENTKRSSFLPYLPVARKAGVKIALAVAADDLEDDAQVLERHGWSVTDPVQAAGTPERYVDYIRRSRGEFSCAKPAYVTLATGWIADRTLCYLASGRPVILQDTGPCRLLDDAEGQGVFRFRDPAGAAAALIATERDHPRQCAMARTLAEEYFDARKSAARVLELSLT
jgi:hypothetical protein